MSLRLRLSLGLSLVLLLAVLGLGAVLYAITAQSFERSFQLELQTLARQYARLAIEAEQVRLREPPPSPLTERLGSLVVFLLDSSQASKDSLGAKIPPHIPDSIWERLKQNQESVFRLSNLRSVAAYPIFSSSADYRLAFVLLVAADDLAGASGLVELRNSILIWSLAATALALVLGQLLTEWLLKPLRQIASTARTVANGQLNARIKDASRQDEIGALKRDLNTMLARLEHLVEAQRRFTAHAAHDLRTPIAVLRTELEVALRRPREASAYLEVLQRVLDRAKSLGILTEDLLALARLEAGLEHPQPLLLHQAIGTSLATYLSAALQKNLAFEIELPENLELHGDAVALNRLVANLLANALRFAKSRIGLRAKEVGQNIEIRVWDDGQGISLDQQALLFDRFQKGAQSSGTGLGLAIAQEAARAHQGSIQLEPSSVGAVFLVSLPSSNARLTQTQYNPKRVKE